MDLLFHFLANILACVLVNHGLEMKLKFRTLILFSIVALLIDIDHLLLYTGYSILDEGLNTSVLHNIFFLFGIVVLIYFLASRVFLVKNEKAINISALFFILLSGHMLFDMIFGRYGVPLFYPLTNRLYVIPRFFEISIGKRFEFPLTTRSSVAWMLYLSLIAIVIKIRKR
ncbi:MAG: metal-dependent hydrolase [Candidatus Altiarchaeota archaeon]